MKKTATVAASLAWGLALLAGRLCFAGQPAPKKPKKPDIIQFRLIENAQGPDTVAMNLKGKNETLHVNKKVLLDALDVEGAKVVAGTGGAPRVSVSFTTRGAKKLAEITGKNIGRRLAVIVKGQLLSAPVIRAKILGPALIEGDFTHKQAHELAAALNAACRN